MMGFHYNYNLENFLLLLLASLFWGTPEKQRKIRRQLVMVSRQLSKIGVAIKGDLKYGSSRSNPDGGIHLHARRLEFIHPVTKENLVVVAPVPQNDSVWAACEIDN